MPELLRVRNLKKEYKYPKKQTLLLFESLNFSLNEGDFVSITGASGSGKSTLMLILAGMLEPTQGEFFLNETKQPYSALNEFRKKHIGFVFQSFQWLNSYNLWENLLLPCRFSSLSSKLQKQKGKELLENLNIYEKRKQYPQEVSGGELQKFAVARALIKEPKIIFADEPTANLDQDSTQALLKEFQKLRKERQLSFLINSHEPRILDSSTQTLQLKNFGLYPFRS